MEDKEYLTTEHYFQVRISLINDLKAQKFAKTELEEKIRLAPTG